MWRGVDMHPAYVGLYRVHILDIYPYTYSQVWPCTLHSMQCIACLSMYMCTHDIRKWLSTFQSIHGIQHMSLRWIMHTSAMNDHFRTSQHWFCAVCGFVWLPHCVVRTPVAHLCVGTRTRTCDMAHAYTHAHMYDASAVSVNAPCIYHTRTWYTGPVTCATRLAQRNDTDGCHTAQSARHCTCSWGCTK
jgi:hypothetical protein